PGLNRGNVDRWKDAALSLQARFSARPRRSRSAIAYGLLDLANLRRIAGAILQMLAFAIDAGTAAGRQTQLQRGPASKLGHRLAPLGFIHELFRVGVMALAVFAHRGDEQRARIRRQGFEDGPGFGLRRAVIASFIGVDRRLERWAESSGLAQSRD